MSVALLLGALAWVLSAAAVAAAWLVFRTDSMVRAAYWLLASLAATGGLLLLLHAEFLGLVLILMMAGEMTIMAVFMVMFMMNPAGLNPMSMVHQHKVAIAAGVLAFLGLGSVALFGRFPDRPLPAERVPGLTEELGFELLGDSMLAFETAGVALLATMVGAIALASRKGRFGAADEGSEAPTPELEALAAHQDEEPGGHPHHHGSTPGHEAADLRVGRGGRDPDHHGGHG